MATYYGYSDGSACPRGGGWAFTVSPDSPPDIGPWDSLRAVCFGGGGAVGMKLGEAEISPLCEGLCLVRIMSAAGRGLRQGDSLLWTVDSEFVALVYSGTYKAKKYPELWSRIFKARGQLETMGIGFDVVHSLRNLCPGQIWVDEHAGFNRRMALDHGPFSDVTWRFLHPIA